MDLCLEVFKKHTCISFWVRLDKREEFAGSCQIKWWLGGKQASDCGDSYTKKVLVFDNL